MPPQEISPVAPSTSAPFLTRARSVLVVDDDPSIGAVLRLAIGTAGYEVIVAASGEEALNLARQGTVDAALIDFEMVPMDGIEVCRRLVALLHEKPIPIWIMTGHFSSARWEQAVKSGAIDLFPKPFERDRFLCELQMAWSAHQAGRLHGEAIHLKP